MKRMLKVGLATAMLSIFGAVAPAQAAEPATVTYRVPAPSTVTYGLQAPRTVTYEAGAAGAVTDGVRAAELAATILLVVTLLS